MIQWKTLCNKSCRSCFIESRTVEFIFFWFFYDFISILQIHCLMRPGRQHLNVIFFLHLGPVANWMGRHPFLKISLFDIYFWIFFNIKIKKQRATAYHPAYGLLWVRGPINRTYQSVYGPATLRAIQVVSVKFACPHVVLMRRKRTFFIWSYAKKYFIYFILPLFRESIAPVCSTRQDEQN